ncbi:MAG: hypothetical protein OXE86_18965 [Alphaproteobacteria bacterium]|nr:hypothetical protein [Alphaproteobacteria bacterium]
MSVSPDDRENDPYAALERAAELVWERARQAIEHDEAARVSDEAVARLMTAAIRLYAAKADGEERTFRPLLGEDDEIVTPTEALTAVTEVLRALRLGPMEFGLWSRRRPEDYHETPWPDER